MACRQLGITLLVTKHFRETYRKVFFVMNQVASHPFPAILSLKSPEMRFLSVINRSSTRETKLLIPFLTNPLSTYIIVDFTF